MRVCHNWINSVGVFSGGLNNPYKEAEYKAIYYNEGDLVD